MQIFAQNFTQLLNNTHTLYDQALLNYIWKWQNCAVSTRTNQHFSWYVANVDQ